MGFADESDINTGIDLFCGRKATLVFMYNWHYIHVFDRNRFISTIHSSYFADCLIHVDMHWVIEYYLCRVVNTYTYVLTSEFNNLKLQTK